MVRTPSAAKRQAILDAATDAFCGEGFEASSMDRIAELAEVSKRTVYNHFESKEVLFQAVVSRLMEKAMVAKRIAWDPSRPIEEQLAAMARTKSTVTSDPTESALTRVVISVYLNRPDLAAALREALTDDPLVPWLEGAHGAGVLCVPDPALAAKIFWAMAGGLLFWPSMLGEQIGDEERERSIAELVSTFLARYRPAAA